MRRAAILLAALVAVFLLAGCVRGGDAPQPEKKAQIPSTARIVCDKEGTRVLTPRVEARPDGVHYTIDNRMGVDSGYSVHTPGGGGFGDNLPKGESRHVEPLAPGARIGISCDPPGYGGEEDLEYATFEVLRGDSGYKSTELECSGGGWVQSGGPQYAFGVKGKEGDPVDMARRRFSDDIKEGDVVEVGGYPEISRSRIVGESRYVRVVRDGKVVAMIQYFREGGGWLEGESAACQRF